MSVKDKDSILIVGGPKHGERMSFPEVRHMLQMVEPEDTYFKATFYYGAYNDINMKTTSYTIGNFPVGHRGIRFAWHPDLSEDTARRVVSDMLMAGWHKG